MNGQIEEIVNRILKKTRIVWFAVFSGMLSIIVMAMVLFEFRMIEPLPVVHPEIADKVTMFIVLILAIAVLYVKRSLLVPYKLKEKSQSENFKPDPFFAKLINTVDGQYALFLKSVQQANRYLFMVWFAADLIVVASFINFIIIPVVDTFFLYCIVGLYSLLINFPQKSLYKKIYNFIHG